MSKDVRLSKTTNSEVNKHLSNIEKELQIIFDILNERDKFTQMQPTTIFLDYKLLTDDQKQKYTKFQEEHISHNIKIEKDKEGTIRFFCLDCHYRIGAGKYEPKTLD